MHSSDKHGPNMAEDMASEPVPPSSRAGEWRDADVGDSMGTVHDAGTPPGMDRQDVTGRSELARHLDPGEFPADAQAIREMAAAHGVPASLRTELTRLPDAIYADVNEVWTALGHGVEDVSRRT